MKMVGQRKRVQRSTDSGSSMMLQQERQEFHKRLSIRRHANGRPLCQYCAKHSAHYTGRRRADNSLVMRKSEGKYVCIACHQKRYNLEPVFLNRELIQGVSY